MTSSPGGVRARRVVWVIVWFFVVSLIAFAIRRVTIDVPNLQLADRLPADDFDTRYAQHPVIAYLHIIPGVAYILLAPFQISKRIRGSSLPRHRRIGRMTAALGALSAVAGIVVGVLFPWAGMVETTASVVFGGYMGYALAAGVGAARNRDITGHRRWMLRAFAVSLGVATIRVVLSLGEQFDLFAFDEAFGYAFWAGFVINAVAVELWLRRWPTQQPRTRQASTA